MLKTATIKIGDQEILLKRTYKTLILFEEQTGVDAYQANTSIGHSMQMFYAMVRANNPSFNMTFDEFLAYCDDHTELYGEYMKYTIALIGPEKAVDESKKVETR